MGIVKAKSVKEINAEIKAKRNPAVGPVVEKEQDAPIGVEDPNNAGANESVEAPKRAKRKKKADNSSSSDSPEEAKTEDQG